MSGTDRQEPHAIPRFGSFATGFVDGRAGGPTYVGRVAPNLVLGGTAYGLVTGNAAANGAIRRNDSPALLRLPVAIARPVWARMSLLGTKPIDQAPRVVADPSAHGPACLDCNYPNAQR